MSGPVVRVQHRSMGRKRWRAVCTCKQLRTEWGGEAAAWKAAETHAFDTGHELWATVLTGAL